jgi:uncharacterized oligopeptide transporter (OPT) family protein
MFAMVGLSLVNHRIEEVYNDDRSVYEWLEKTSVATVAIATILQFRSQIDSFSWVFLSISLLLFLYAHKAYYLPGKKGEYIFSHTIWHLGTGVVIVRIIDNAPNVSLNKSLKSSNPHIE